MQTVSIPFHLSIVPFPAYWRDNRQSLTGLFSIYLQIVAKEIATAEKRNSSADVFLTVEDVNDHFPHFAQQMYNATVSENAPRGTSVITITVR